MPSKSLEFPIQNYYLCHYVFALYLFKSAASELAYF